MSTDSCNENLFSLLIPERKSSSALLKTGTARRARVFSFVEAGFLIAKCTWRYSTIVFLSG